MKIKTLAEYQLVVNFRVSFYPHPQGLTII